MLGALKAAAKKEAAANPTKVQPAAGAGAGAGSNKSNPSKSGATTTGAAKVSHHHPAVAKKPRKKGHDWEEEEMAAHHAACEAIGSMFILILHGFQQGCGSIATCGICFDRYSEKQEMVEKEDEHDTKCQADTKVLSWLGVLIIVVGLFAYLISISFVELPAYVRAEFFSEVDCKVGTVTSMEYVPTATCMKWKKQSLSAKKRPKALLPGEAAVVVQSGKPPKKPESVVYTFTEHYMWGLSWYADMYEKNECLSADGLPQSIATVESEETGTIVKPLYNIEQMRDVCLSRDQWDYGTGKSARILGSRCLGNRRMHDILGMYVDPECKSLVKAIAYNLTFFKSIKAPKNTDKWEKCTKSEVDGMYYARVVVTNECKSKYDQYGEKINDNSVFTDQPWCDSELECPDKNGRRQPAGSYSQPMDTPTLLIIVLFTAVLPCLLGCVFYSMTCHTIAKKMIRRD